MARSANTDPFQNFRFHLVEAAASAGGGADVAPRFLLKDAGFMSLNLPNITLDQAEYKTGIMKFKQKYPGPPSITDVSLTQGIFRAESPLLKWVEAILNGGQDYRRDLLVYHYHIMDKFDKSVAPLRIIRLEECWPMDLKPNPDYEANSAEVSIAELTISCERFKIEPGNSSTFNLSGTP